MNQSITTFAKALADETRQEMMRMLCCQWLSVNDIVDALGGRVNQPTVSHHLKWLTEAKLVHLRQEGRQRFYTLNQEYFTVCCGALMRNFAPSYAPAQAPSNTGAGEQEGSANSHPVPIVLVE
jgi:DNA-binding transcriptional ArsR family regulator